MTGNDGLIKINKFFSAKKVSMNVGKSNFSLFNFSGRKGSILSPLKKLKIKNQDIERVSSINFFGVSLDEN